MRSKSDLRPAQLYIIEKFKALPKSLAIVPMGGGKTAAAATAAKYFLDNFTIQRVLCVAPLRVATDTWPDEIAEWEHLKYLRWTLLRSPDYAKFKALTYEETDFHIINREQLPKLVECREKDWPYDMLVYDESSRMKAGKKRTPTGALSEYGALCWVMNKFDRVIELTGTPAAEGVEGLYPQIYVLDRGERLGRNITQFRKRYMVQGYRRWDWSLRPGAEQAILDAVKDIAFALPENIAPYPGVKPRKVLVKLPQKIMEEYKRFERTLLSEQYDVRAVSAGVLHNKLIQFANGSMYRNHENGSRSVVKVHDEKLYALESLAAEWPGHNLLIAYSYAFDRDAIKKKFKDAVIAEDEPDFIKKWNAGKIRKMLVHPASMGHGLNMQKGGNIVVWYGMTDKAELYMQLNKRLARPGQEEKDVWIYHLIAVGTKDEEVYENMGLKVEGEQKMKQSLLAEESLFI